MQSRKDVPLSRRHARVVPVTVTEEDVKRGKLTLPEIEAEVKPIAAVGQTPSLKFKRPDGTDGTLTDFRGSLTVVQFWTASCEACKEQLPALRERYALTSEDGIAMVGLSLDEDAEVLEEGSRKTTSSVLAARTARCAEGLRRVDGADVLAARS